jgi:hypothetical protein
MKIGFTGTQRGMTEAQQWAVARELDALPPGHEFHHGDCIGADAEAHFLAKNRGYRVVIHPPTDEKKRAFCAGYVAILRPAPYLERNQAIVAAVDRLIAAPAEDREILRSGTWATIRHALRKGIPVVAFAPDGRRIPLDASPMGANITTSQGGG